MAVGPARARGHQPCGTCAIATARTCSSRSTRCSTAAGRPRDDVAALVVGTGPGSFTGPARRAWPRPRRWPTLRDLPLVGVASTDALRRAAARARRRRRRRRGRPARRGPRPLPGTRGPRSPSSCPRAACGRPSATRPALAVDLEPDLLGADAARLGDGRGRWARRRRSSALARSAWQPARRTTPPRSCRPTWRCPAASAAAPRSWDGRPTSGEAPRGAHARRGHPGRACHRERLLPDALAALRLPRGARDEPHGALPRGPRRRAPGGLRRHLAHGRRGPRHHVRGAAGLSAPRHRRPAPLRAHRAGRRAGSHRGDAGGAARATPAHGGSTSGSASARSASGRATTPTTARTR